MIPKKLAPAKAGVADFSDKIMRKIKENREHFRFNLIEKRSDGRRRPRRKAGFLFSILFPFRLVEGEGESYGTFPVATPTGEYEARRRADAGNLPLQSDLLQADLLNGGGIDRTAAISAARRPTQAEQARGQDLRVAAWGLTQQHRLNERVP